MATIVLKLLLLAGWVFFLGWLLLFGQTDLARLLHPDLWWLLVAAAVILALFFLGQWRRLWHGGGGRTLWWQWPSLLILSLPLLFFLQAGEARFTSETFAQRSLVTAEGYRLPQLGGEPSAKVTSGETPLSDLYRDLNGYLGKEVEVVCQTLVDRRLPPNIVMCYRYLMNCCAADAIPLFIFIKHREGMEIDNDSWIHARGTLGLQKSEAVEVPLLELERMAVVEEPPFPFLLR